MIIGEAALLERSLSLSSLVRSMTMGRLPTISCGTGMIREDSAGRDQPAAALSKQPVELSLSEARSRMRVKPKESVQHSFRPADRTCVSHNGRKESVRVA